MKTTTPTTTLRHNQIIRVMGFSQYANMIAVGTARGYAAQHGGDAEESHQRALDNGHDTAWANQAAGELTADYEGKAEGMAAKAAAIAAAPEIENGQTVEIEGELFTVRVTGERFSDPVHFKRIG
jgi:hypothetical protein